ncbi:MAG: hypothetical protein N4P89_00765 [Candidatus Lightella neohaematopini]|nr:hypothetical protein [Candidatus Lightella neohaematopini]MCV2528708.1 hypothetical protein [Candidatus Lightella neohaematopini]
MKKYLLLVFSSILIFSCSSNINITINKIKHINISSDNHNDLLMEIILKGFNLHNILITTNCSNNIPKLIISNLTQDLIVQPIDKNHINLSLCINIKLILYKKTICKTIEVNHILISNYNYVDLEIIKNNLLLKCRFYQEFVEQLLLYIINYI